MTAPLFELLAWDTAFFGYRIGRINGRRADEAGLAKLTEWAADESIDCMYFLADSDHAETVRLIEDYGFRFVDIRLTFSQRLQTIPKTQSDDNVVFRTAHDTDYEALQFTAQNAYVHSRFYYDPCFTQAQSATLYETWLRRSFLESYADEVMVAEMNGEPVGYVTCHLSHDTGEGSIGLVGVKESARGHKIGQRLVDASLHWFAEKGMQSVSVVTQGRNVAAQRLYQKCGFLTQLVQLWYHKWFSDCTREERG